MPRSKLQRLVLSPPPDAGPRLPGRAGERLGSVLEADGPLLGRRTSLAVEIVGRLVQQQEIRLCEDHRGEGRPRAKPAGEGRGQRLRRGVHPGPAERFGEALVRQRRPDTEQAGNRLASPVETPAQHSELAAHGNFSGRRRQVPVCEVQQRGFADAVLTEKSDAFLIETEAQV